MASTTPKKSATPAKKSTTTRKSGAKPATSAKRKPQQARKPGAGGARKPQPASPLRIEVTSIIITALGALMVLSLFSTDGAGFLGGFMKRLLLGLFGVGAYILPFAIIVGSLIVLFQKSKNVSTAKIVMSAFVLLIIISLAHIINAPAATPGGTPFDYIKAGYTEGTAGNGGLFGAIVGNCFVSILGKTGTYILLGASALVLTILISGQSLFLFISTAFNWIDGKIQESRDARYDDEYDDEDYDEEFDEDDYEEEIPVKPLKQNPVRIQKPKNLPPAVRKNGNRGKAFDHLIDDTEPGNDEPRLKLITEDFINTKEMIVKPKRAAKPEINPPVEIENMEEYIEPEIRGFEKFEPHTDEEIAAAETPAPIDDDFSINVRGIVEGYTPGVVDAEGEIFVNTSGATTKSVKPDKSKKAEEEAEDMLKSTLEIAADFDEYEYIFPPVELLKENTYTPSLSSKAQILENSKKLEETLKSFGVEAKVVEVSKGPTVTRYELSPGLGVKVSKISGLSDDLALNLAAAGIRIEAPIPGKAVVGIEIPNKETQSVFLREVIDDEAFWKFPSKVCFALGKDIAGNTVIADIAKMPHLLIAGATGSGKSVCINTIITSIIYKSRPDEVKLLMVDPKVVELSVYNGIPHLLIPVVTEPKKAAGALNWAVREMDLRYNMFAETVTRDLKGYNMVRAENDEPPLPQIVIIIDELADLMMTCGKEVEESICRLAQKARAAGIHLIIATQRPSVDVITGLIKANVPSRLAFAVSSGTDSRTILDTVGAEKLLGKGDMLFSPVGLSKPQRIQGSFISDKEVENIVNFIKSNKEYEYDTEMIEKITAAPESTEASEDSDEYIDESIAFIVEKEKASVSMLQRRFRIGYNRAARMMEELEARGIVGPEDGSKPRKVLMSQYEWRDYKERKKQE